MPIWIGDAVMGPSSIGAAASPRLSPYRIARAPAAIGAPTAKRSSSQVQAIGCRMFARTATMTNAIMMKRNP